MRGAWLVIEETSRAKAGAVWPGDRRRQGNAVECDAAEIVQRRIDYLALSEDTIQLFLVGIDLRFILDGQTLLSVRVAANIDGAMLSARLNRELTRFGPADALADLTP